jgi:hypothetical protein
LVCLSIFFRNSYRGCFTTLGHNCRRWFPRSLWWKSSYKHVSDFRRLRSYGRFLIPVHALVWTLQNQLAGHVLSLVAYFCQLQTAQFLPRGSQPSGSLCCGRRWRFQKPALSTNKLKLKLISRS